jgi:alpha-tubulin suppressor-like RCC1 family protein
MSLHRLLALSVVSFGPLLSMAAELPLKTMGFGLYHSCGVLMDGKVRCIGSNSYGQLGKGGPSDYASNSGLGKADINRRQSFEVVGLAGVKAVSGGNMFTCAVREAGSVACWGQGKYGQLGNGGVADSSTPVEVEGISDAIAVAAGNFHACALKKEGSVWCWGLHKKGSLGDGSAVKQAAKPVRVAELAGAVRIQVRGDATCAQLSDQSVKCWGEPVSPRAFGKSAAPAFKPVELFAAAEGAVDFTIGSKTQCLLNRAGKIRCVGHKFVGITPGAKPTDLLKEITEVPAPQGEVTQIAVSDDNGIGTYLCALLKAGQVQCLGGGALGQLGNGQRKDSPVWTTVTGLSGAQRLLSGGAAYLFADVGNGKFLGWGFNNNLGGVAGIGKMLEAVVSATSPAKLVTSN